MWTNAGTNSTNHNNTNDEGASRHGRSKEDSNVAIIVPRGYKIRDEFVCPITRELITDPVIAADGHTYDRPSIEQWIHGLHGNNRTGANKGCRTSPKTGEPLEHLHLIPNHNLKRLLRDMIKEGGEAIYARDENEACDDTLSENQDDNNGEEEDFSVLEDCEHQQSDGPKVDPAQSSNALTSDREHQFSREMSNMTAATNVMYNNNTDSETEKNTRINSDTDNNTPKNTDTAAATGPVDTTKKRKKKKKMESHHHSGPRIALVNSKVLHCRCLGPPESDWNNRSFRLTQSSSDILLGGRRRPNEHTMQNFVQFVDATVSRRHFEVRYHEGGFQIRDLGSAGGTFIRIPPRKGIELSEGTMIMLGKHQLQALSVCPLNDNHSDAQQKQRQQQQKSHQNDISGKCVVPKKVTEEMHAENMVVMQKIDISEHTSKIECDYEDNDDKSHTTNDDNDDKNGYKIENEPSDDDNSIQNDSKPNNIQERQTDKQHLSSGTRSESVKSQNTSVGTGNGETDNKSHQKGSNTSQESRHVSNETTLATHGDSRPLMVLRCFAPEGTPIQNRKFEINRNGATLGRKQSNTISFSHQIDTRSFKFGRASTRGLLGQQQQTCAQSYVGIDSSISGEHAAIKYNEKSGKLELFDGVNNDKGSTNGTWIRLSPMHEESDWFYLNDKSEILIGTVRFRVLIETVVVEKDLYD